MVTYCLGPDKIKRKVFRDMQDLFIDCNNDEMLPDANFEIAEDFAIAAQTKKYGHENLPKPVLPFKDFSVIEYIRYQRSFIDAAPLSVHEVKDRLYLVGFKKRETTLIKRLSVIDFRLVMLASKLEESNLSKMVHLNFDGIIFNKKNAKLLNSALSYLNKYFKLFVSISDIRLAKKGGKVLDYTRSSEVPRVMIA